MNKKMLIKIVACICIYALSSMPVQASGAKSRVDIQIQESTKIFRPGDTIKIAWTPLETPVKAISFIPVKKGKYSSYAVYSDKVSGDPTILTGSYDYNLVDYSIPSGSYYIGLTLEKSGKLIKSEAKVTIENKPSFFFGTKKGEANAILISPGKSVTLKWDVESVKKCQAESFPKHPKWQGALKANGERKIRVDTTTTFYLKCKNNLGEIVSSFKVETSNQKRSDARLVPSTTFIDYFYALGTSQREALSSDQSITLFNASPTETIYFKINTSDQPSWINSGFNTAQMSLEPNGVMGLGAFADPSNITKPGKYKWNLKLEGSFSNSPLLIPITMTITE